jgi:hypothetical protein
VKPTVPVVLFAYSRPDHLARTLESLRSNEVPLIYAFSDGPKTPKQASNVATVREILHNIDWCDIDLCFRDQNLGLGKSIRTGVSAVLKKHDSVIVFEDDIVCVPGTYRYMCEALKEYCDNLAVMSVTGWTHPRVTPPDVTNQPYFDGRAECWVWGAWAHSWQGMEDNAKEIRLKCEQQGIDVTRYGDDLAEMAEHELEKNIWAVRFLYLHMLRNGLCLRPPRSMVNHVGVDASATNAEGGNEWVHPNLKDCPPIPEKWPPAVEHPDCARLWQKACRNPTFFDRVKRKLVRLSSKALSRWS